ncbi:unnamed protein product [Adineta steineri]|uniref:G-protein coupled receptors family 1 profile domain-containing protein n=1 Tax=Adineta steineri TaxID=433720 RepID=A0A814GNJ1_9BILA|nr:unnamed protein product [Adineta steineri]CAF1111107.1 unnamed protein product [Adineta steineri]
MFDYKYIFINQCSKKINSSDTSSLNEETFDKQSSLISNYSVEKKEILHKKIHSFSLLLVICLLITNWFCLGLVYIFPKFYPNLIINSTNICIYQGFFLHVLTVFHLHLIICLYLLWHFCFLLENYWQTITYQRIFYLLIFIFMCLCLFTLPSISNEWASIKYDKTLQICIVNYTYNYSYTFFILTFICIIPFIILIISHRQYMISIKNRISKIFSIDLLEEKTRFQYSSYIILIWSCFNILLLILLHIPTEYKQIRMIVYYTQLLSYLFDPILYIFIFRTLSIISLLRPINEIYLV